MIARGNKEIQGRNRGTKGVTAVYRGTKSVWTAGHVFDNVITGTTVGPNQSVAFKLNYDNSKVYEVTSDANGNFSVKLDMEGVSSLYEFYSKHTFDYNETNLKTINLNRLDTSQIENFSYVFFRTYSLEEVDMSMCDLSIIGDFISPFRWTEGLKSFKTTNFGNSLAMEWISAGSWEYVNINFGQIWYDMIVTNGFNRAEAGYPVVRFILDYRRNYETEFGFTDEILAEIASKGYTIVLNRD